jgi:hypothetical protein
MRGIFRMAALLASLSPAFAEPTRDAVMAGAQRCYGLSDNHAWLECFYGSAEPMRTMLGLPPAPASQVRLVPPAGSVPPRPVISAAAPAQEHSGGFFEALLDSTRPVVSSMPMAGYRFARDRSFTVTLQDGSVWQQTPGDAVFASWKKPPETYLVTITGGTGSSYALKVKSQPGVTYRVARR